MENVNENEYNVSDNTVSNNELTLYLDNHDHYILGRCISAFICSAMVLYMLVARQDPIVFTVLTGAGMFFLIISLFEIVPMLMMEHKYGIALKDHVETCYPLRDKVRQVTSCLMGSVAFLFVAAIMALAMEMPYL